MARGRAVLVADGLSSGWRPQNGSTDQKTWRVIADTPYEARTHPKVPAPYSAHPQLYSLYASAIEARFINGSRRAYDVSVTYTVRPSGDEPPRDPQPGDEFWKVSSFGESQRILYALAKPEVLYEDDGVPPVESGLAINHNPQTGEIGGVDDEVSGGITVTLTQYRSRSNARGAFAIALSNCVKKVNANAIFGFPARCVRFYDFSFGNDTDGLIPVEYIFHARPAVDISDIEIVKSTGQTANLPSKTLGGYEYLEFLQGEKPIDNGAKQLHFTRRVRRCRLFRTSDFSALGLSGVLA